MVWLKVSKPLMHTAGADGRTRRQRMPERRASVDGHTRAGNINSSLLIDLIQKPDW